MEGKRNLSDFDVHDQSKKIKTIHQIEALADGEIPNLPNEIFMEILARLPVKSLLRFRCVSKSWFSLISSSNFINTHVKISSENPTFSNHRIMLTVSNPDFDFNIKTCSVHSVMFEPLTVATDVDYPMRNPHTAIWIVGSLNGLICIARDEKDIFLWNPITRKLKELPHVAVEMKKGFFYMWGFGFSESEDDYKIVGIFCVLGIGGVSESMVKIYSLKTSSWKRIEDFKGGIPLNDSGKYANGKLHFEATPGYGYNFRWNIVSLDLKSEVYGMVEQPNYEEGHSESSLSLGVLGGCICILCSYQKTCADLWVLKEYGIKESWTKVVTIPYNSDPGKFIYSNPLCILPDGEVLLVLGENFVLYNPKDNCFKHLGISNISPFIEASIYIESLVSL